MSELPVYDGVTQPDFAGPHQFLSRTPDLEIRVASLGGQSITADHLTFSDLDNLTAVDSCDVLLVPGGGGCVAVIENADHNLTQRSARAVLFKRLETFLRLQATNEIQYVAHNPGVAISTTCLSGSLK